MKQGNLFLLSVLLLMLTDSVAAAQPTCFSTFSAFDTCNPNYFASEYVFLGRVLKLEEVKTSNMRQLKARVRVEETLKGEISGSVEVTMSGVCAGIMVEDKTFIFIINHRRRSELAGFYSSMWSTPVDEIGRADLTKLLDEIRALLRGTPQPRITGSLVEQGWNPDGRVYTARTRLNPPLGYDPRYAHPLGDIVVLAEDKNGNQFRTRTDSHGRFQFDKLPSGKYGVRPLLPNKMDVYANGSPLNDGESQFIEINSWLCSVEVSFDVQQTGTLAGHSQIEGDGSKEEVDLYLVRVVPANNSVTSPTDFTYGSIRPSYTRLSEGAGTVFEFRFDRVPVGPYVLLYEINSARGAFNFFYPGVQLYEQAKVITVKAREQTDLKIKVDSPN